MYLALLADNRLRSASGGQIAWRATVGALMCFLSAGFSELFVALQAALLTLGLLFAPAFIGGMQRRNVMLLLASAWLATIASAIVQSNSPGVAIRMQAESMSYAMTFREYLEWAARALDFSIQVVGYPRAFAGFALLFCVGFGAALHYSRPRALEPSGNLCRLSRALHWLGLFSQLLILPLLWTHQSDDPLVLGRFNPAAAVVVTANALLILYFAIVIWGWRRISAAMARDTNLAWLHLCAFIAAALLLFGLTQLYDIHWQGNTYLYFSTLLLFLLLAGQLAASLRDTRRRFSLVAVLSTLVAWLLIGATIFIAFVSVGYMQMRLLALASAAMVFSGLVWVACVGCSIKQWLNVCDASQQRIAWLAICSVIVALMIGINIVSSQARRIPGFAGYAREWDERHQAIIAQRDRGERDIIVQPLRFNMPRFLGHTQDREVLFRYALAYYGVDSITALES